jgi:hypothetical protein
MTLFRAVLTAIKTPGLSSALRLLPTITLTGIKLNVDKIKHIFIVLVLPTKQGQCKAWRIPSPKNLTW